MLRAADIAAERSDELATAGAGLAVQGAVEAAAAGAAELGVAAALDATDGA